MPRKHYLFLFLFLFAFFQSFSRDLDEIKRSGKLYVGLTQYDYENINYLLAKEFARYLNVEFIEVTITRNDIFSINGVFPDDVITNPQRIYTPDIFSKVDVICSNLSRQPWRAKLFDLAGGLTSAELLVYRKSLEIPLNYSMLGNKKIAFSSGTSFEENMTRINEENGGSIILLASDNDEIVKDLFREKQADGIILDADEALKFVASDNDAMICFPISKAVQTGWAVEKGNELGAEIDHFFENISNSGLLDDLFTQKFGVSYSEYKLKLSEYNDLEIYHRDLDEILASKKLVVGLRERKFVYDEEEKQFMHALAEEFADYLGVTLEYVIVPSISKYWENSEGKIVKDSAYSPPWFNYFDVACEVFAPLDWRLNKIDMVGIYPSEYNVIAKKGTPIKSIEDLKKLKGVTAKGSVYEGILAKNGLKNLQYESVKNFIPSILNGSADYTILYNAFVETADYPELETKISLGTVDVSWGLRKDQPLLKAKIEEFVRDSRRKGLIRVLMKAMKGQTLQSANDFISSYYESFQTGQQPSIIYSSEDGLPQEDVFTIFQDSKAYMWFGTNSGAVRYNGRTMETMKGGLQGASIFDICEDSTDALYFATSKGIISYKNDTIEKTLLEEYSFRKIFKDAHDWLWCNTNNKIFLITGEDVYDFTDGFPAVQGKINEITGDADGEDIFIATSEGVFRYNVDQRKIEKVIDVSTYALNVDYNDSLWFSTSNGLFITHLDNLSEDFDIRSVKNYNAVFGLGASTLVKSIIQNKYGSVWLISEEEIVQVFSTDQKGRIYHKGKELSNNSILSFAQDLEDNIWIGFSGGLQKLSNQKSLKNFYPDRLKSYVYSIEQDQRGRLWLTTNTGVYYFNGQLKDFTSYLGKGSSNKYLLNILPDGNLLITSPEAFYVVDVNTLKVIRKRSFDRYIFGLENVFVTSSREIFLLTGINGLVYYFSDMYARPVVVDNKLSYGVFDMAEYSGHYVAGNNNGLVLLDEGDMRPYKQTNCEVWSLFPDGKLLWIGTECGLQLLEGDTIKPVKIRNFEEGLSIKSIASARNRNFLWLGTNEGVMYFNRSTRELEFTISSKDGLRGEEITVEGLFVDENGLLWIGTYHGVSNYNIKAKQPIKYAPFCYVEKFLLNNEPYKLKDNMVFRYNENNLLFEITALSFSDESSIEYEYYLRGINHDYLSYYKGDDYRAKFTNLPPGKYEFLFKAKGKNNIWGYVQKVQFTIQKAWYNTWFFRISLGLLILFVIILVYRIRLRAIQKQRDRLEELVNERTRELREAYDEIEAQRDLATNQRDQIASQKKEITDSIQYAQQIQRSLLPSPKDMKQKLNDHFVLFKPRDIVSGDFYWLSERNGRVIYTAADCTGHGVPGGFMSMMGITYLNELVNVMSINDTGKMLDQLRKDIIKALGQKDIDSTSKDGMDMALCVIDFKKRKLQFSGANNPLYLIRNQELIEIKGDKMPIGIYSHMEPFTMHDISLEKDDVIYVFSDGYPDQFGGERDKKFTYKRFKNLLLEVSTKPMNEQKEILENRLYEWMGMNEQLDDIVVVGVRIVG